MVFTALKKTIFDELEQYGIVVQQKDKFHPNFIVFDFESLLSKVQKKVSNKILIIQKHIPVSVSVASNVSGFTSAKCFIGENMENLLKDMVEYMLKISEASMQECKKKWQEVFNFLDKEIVFYAKSDENKKKNCQSPKAKSCIQKMMSLI